MFFIGGKLLIDICFRLLFLNSLIVNFPPNTFNSSLRGANSLVIVPYSLSANEFMYINLLFLYESFNAKL